MLNKDELAKLKASEETVDISQYKPNGIDDKDEKNVRCFFITPNGKQVTYWENRLSMKNGVLHCNKFHAQKQMDYAERPPEKK